MFILLFAQEEQFLGNAILLLKMAKEQHYHICLSVKIQPDLAWWK